MQDNESTRAANSWRTAFRQSSAEKAVILRSDARCTSATSDRGQKSCEHAFSTTRVEGSGSSARSPAKAVVFLSPHPRRRRRALPRPPPSSPDDERLAGDGDGPVAVSLEPPAAARAGGVRAPRRPSCPPSVPLARVLRSVSTRVGDRDVDALDPRGRARGRSLELLRAWAPDDARLRPRCCARRRRRARRAAPLLSRLTFARARGAQSRRPSWMRPSTHVRGASEVTCSSRPRPRRRLASNATTAARTARIRAATSRSPTPNLSAKRVEPAASDVRAPFIGFEVFPRRAAGGHLALATSSAAPRIGARLTQNVDLRRRPRSRRPPRTVSSEQPSGTAATALVLQERRARTRPRVGRPGRPGRPRAARRRRRRRTAGEDGEPRTPRLPVRGGGGGTLKPAVTFFGGSVPVEDVEGARPARRPRTPTRCSTVTSRGTSSVDRRFVAPFTGRLPAAFVDNGPTRADRPRGLHRGARWVPRRCCPLVDHAASAHARRRRAS